MDIARCKKGHFYDKSASRNCPECAAMEEEDMRTIAVDPKEPSMLITRCANGHYYDTGLGDCPICAAEQQIKAEPVEVDSPMQVLKCEKGHYYNGIQCPICAPALVEIEPMPENNMVTCSEGHLYDKSISGECPLCAAAKVDKVDCDFDFTEVEDMKNTLLFTAFQGMSFRLWKDGEGMKLTARSLIQEPSLVLEKTVSIPEQEAAAIAYKIQSVLFQWLERGLELDKIFCGSGNEWDENVRLLFKTVQINCDYRWKKGIGDYSPANQSMRQIHAILGRSFDKLTGDNGYSPECDNLWAELEFSYSPVCRIFSADGKCWLELRDRFYYEFVDSIVVTGRVAIPAAKAQELLRMLAESGIMEGLIRKNALPNESACIDPGHATVFRLKWNDLTFSYQDWNKSGGDAYAPMKKAYEYLVQTYIRYDK